MRANHILNRNLVVHQVVLSFCNNIVPFSWDSVISQLELGTELTGFTTPLQCSVVQCGGLASLQYTTKVQCGAVW